MKNKNTAINMIATLILQVMSIVSGFIVPRIILTSFGSETNGLVSSLSQFLNYVAIIEGGVNGVIMANLYKPLALKDYKKVSSIINTSNKIFRKLSIIIAIYTICLAILYPIVFNSSYSWWFVFSLTLILSIKLFSQYCFALSFRNLLNVDKKVYYVSLVQAALIILDTISAIIIIIVFPNIHILKLVSAIIFLLQPLLFNRYVKKHYPIDKNAPISRNLLRKRWDGLAINIAYFIHSNTDIVLISIFRNLKEVSVYSIYSLVTNGLKTLCQSLWKALSPSTGKLYALGDLNKLNVYFDTFEYLTFLMTYFIFSIAGLLITPFVQLYTMGVMDADYNQPVFGAILLIAEALYILREPYVSLAYNADKFKEIRIYAIIEVIINIIVSLLLIRPLGLFGVAIGTLCAMAFRTVSQVLYLRKNLIYRPFRKFLYKFIVFSLPTAALLFVCASYIPIKELTISEWILKGLVYCALFIVCYLIISLIFFKSNVKQLKDYIKGEKI